MTPAALFYRAAAAPAATRWALFSDTHIPANAQEEYRGFKPVVNLTMAVKQAAAAAPAGALICGDIARQEGALGDYEALKPLIAPLADKIPVAMVLGNHDDRDNFMAALGSREAGTRPLKNRQVLVIDAGAVRLVVLDSLMAPHTVPGFLGKAQRDWLKGWLAQPQDKPVLLFVHHTLDDGDGSLLDAPRLFEIAKTAPAVKAIVYGHSHFYKYDVWEGIHLINLPAVGYNFRDSEPVGWVDASLTARGGAFTLRAVGGNLEKNGKTVELNWRS